MLSQHFRRLFDSDLVGVRGLRGPADEVHAAGNVVFEGPVLAAPGSQTFFCRTRPPALAVLARTITLGAAKFPAGLEVRGGKHVFVGEKKKNVSSRLLGASPSTWEERAVSRPFWGARCLLGRVPSYIRPALA